MSSGDYDAVIFDERREAKRLGLNVHQYRAKLRAEAAGISFEDQVLLDGLALFRREASARGVRPSDWWAQEPTRGVKKMLLGGVTEASRRHGLSVEEILDSWEPGTVKADVARPLAQLATATVHEDPPQVVLPSASGTLTKYEISAGTEAAVEASGSIAVTRGRDLAAKGWGTAAGVMVGLGPLGAFLFGNAKESVHDGRELYLLITDPGWHYSLAVHPDFGAQARDFVQAINRVAKSLGSATAPATAPKSKLDRLKELADLRAAGVVTEEEFASLKAEILSE